MAQAESEIAMVAPLGTAGRLLSRTGPRRRPSPRSRGSGAPTAASASGRSRVGTSSVGLLVVAEDQHGQPLGDRRGLVAGEPDQLGSGGDQDPVQLRACGIGQDTSHPRCVVLVRERRRWRRLGRGHRVLLGLFLRWSARMVQSSPARGEGSPLTRPSGRSSGRGRGRQRVQCGLLPPRQRRSAVPVAARCRPITTAIRMPRKLKIAIIQAAAARPDASASPGDAPAAVWSSIRLP